MKTPSHRELHRLLLHTPYYIEVITDGLTGEDLIQAKIKGDLPASLIQRYTECLGTAIPVGFARVKWGYENSTFGVTTIEWPILRMRGSDTSPTASLSETS